MKTASRMRLAHASSPSDTKADLRPLDRWGRRSILTLGVAALSIVAPIAARKERAAADVGGASR